MPVLVDTNVLLDVAVEDAKWCEWSAARLQEAANGDGLWPLLVGLEIRAP